MPPDITRGETRKKKTVHLHNSIHDIVSREALGQPAREKDLPKNDPTTIKIQLQPESQYKQHKGHHKSIKFRRSRKLHH